MTSTASSDGGPAGSSCARGKSSAGPYCIDPITRPVVVAVDGAPGAPVRPRPARSSGACPTPRPALDCHQTHPWQTFGASWSVTPVKPATLVLTARILGRAPVASGPGEETEGDEASSPGPARHGARRPGGGRAPPRTSSGCARAGASPRPYGMQIWPPWRWPARTRSNAPAGAGRSRSGSGRAGCAGPRPGRPAARAASRAAPVRARIDADDLDPPAAQLDRPRLVDQHRRRAELGDGARLRERVARVAKSWLPSTAKQPRQPSRSIAQPAARRSAATADRR